MSAWARERGPVAAGWIAWLGAAVLVVALGSPSLLAVGSLAAVWALWGISMNLIWGYAGQFSMAQVGLGGLAAYTAALLVDKADWGLWPAIVAGLCAAVLASAVVALASMRLTGFQFAIMTLAFVLLFVSVLESWELAGRSTGIASSFEFGTVDLGFATWELDSRDGGFMLFAVALCSLALLALGRVLRTRSGRALLALREDPLLASSLGVRPSTYRVVAFTASALVAGVAGILHAAYLRFISPGFFGLTALIGLIVIVVLGGRGHRFGPVLGAAIYYLLVNELSLSDGVFGVILLVLVLVAPDGLLGVAQRLAARLRGHDPAPQAAFAGPRLGAEPVEGGRRG